MVCLDEHIDPEHMKLADRHDVQFELRYSQLVDVINRSNESSCVDQTELVIDTIDRAIDNRISYKNTKRKELDMRPMSPWSKQYALLQEVTKLGFKRICGEVTIAHTIGEIPEFGVTGFYEVGLELGLIDESVDMVGYSSE